MTGICAKCGCHEEMIGHLFNMTFDTPLCFICACEAHASASRTSIESTAVSRVRRVFPKPIHGWLDRAQPAEN